MTIRCAELDLAPDRILPAQVERDFQEKRLDTEKENNTAN